MIPKNNSCTTSNDYICFTDGAYSSSRNQGGVGIIILKGDKEILHYSNMYKNTSNNQMELGAVIIALRLIKKHINSLTIYSDSMYVIGCITLGWKRIKNRIMWEEFDKQYNRVMELCPNIQLIHVKGHQKGDSILEKYNNLVDELAVKASQRL